MIRTMVAAALIASAALSAAATPAPATTVTNPMIWADVPDPDVIRVGDDFYMVSTTMHLMPGCPVMKSRDLANWEIIGYVFDRIEDTPRYSLLEGTAYGRGQWATSLRYHDGRFYVLFSANDEPHRSHIFSATDPAGPWTLVSRPEHFHDSSFLFDDDGRVYVYSGSGTIRVREMLPDLSGVKPGGVDTIVVRQDEEDSGLLEGSRAIKHNGKYYLLAISWPQGKPRRQLCYRADNIEGPYEKKEILRSTFGGFSYVGQGTIVDGPDGSWWGIIFQDRGGVGRVLTLEPCTWTDGWPMLGDSEGRVPDSVATPYPAGAPSNLICSDTFDAATLAPCWQWNHNPTDSAWSLTERPGALRLHTSRVVDNLFDAPNTISQRMSGPACSATATLDISGMSDGDVAGFSAFNGDAGVLAIVRENGKNMLVMQEQNVALDDNDKRVTDVAVAEHARVPLTSSIVQLRIDADFRPGKDIATFFYSTDGNSWHRIGPDFVMRFDYRRLFMGTRFAIFNYATNAAGGYIDIENFDFKQL
ncbi:MAG: glycoside hydrolase 43 family protein [Muribaculaceae bacterium]|nr:glycoside hydrolase 43 family protein [Muribaculaceae bacterium]